MKGFLVSGTASGVGKTTVALAIMAGLRRRGFEVQPFKCGPDFLDTSHHTRICGRVARNLDTWMLSAEANRNVMQSAARGADIVVAEGMMGLFDGTDGHSNTGSSSEIAKLLRLPVILVIDASKSARSVAAMVLGFEKFDPELSLAGVVLNRVAGEHHYALLSDAIQTSCETKILGWLPYETKITIPERHLGLQGASELVREDREKAIDAFAALAERHLNLDAMLRLDCIGKMVAHASSPALASRSADNVRIGVPSDPAFSFYYEDNLDLLRESGSEIVRFSPLHDASLPPVLDALYLGGGYPELHAEKLSRNLTMLEAIRVFAASGRPVYAECGGLLYLSESLRVDDRLYRMAGILPLTTEMTARLVNFGYATIELTADCILGRKGTVVRGHSFHYSRIASGKNLETSYKVQYTLSGHEELEGFRHGRVLASYIHLHFRASPEIAKSFVATTRQVRSLQAVTA
jgi:cobyrinic acid a,c-diamide synthase